MTIRTQSPARRKNASQRANQPYRSGSAAEHAAAKLVQLSEQGITVVSLTQGVGKSLALGLAQLVTLGIAVPPRRARMSAAEAMARNWTNVGRDLTVAFHKVKAAGSPRS